ncbi:MAG: polyprenyl synthetase family protein [Methanomassiliicoccales archaeon]|nr:polyprenyl synthetase family protein [Methanomassiliicoccales archaeon]
MMPLSWDEPISEELLMVENEIRRNVQSQQEMLTEISMHIIGSGGKRIRPGVSLLAYHAVGGQKPDEIIGIAAAFEIIHSATLIHDDINDGGHTRRGVVTAYRKYGVQQALIAGDFLFVKGFRLGGSLGQELVDVIADACTGMAESEILQGQYEKNPSTSLDVYIKIIKGKTAKPFEAGARTGATLGGGSSEQVNALGLFGLNLGIAFQIIDDILDITGDASVLGKPRGMDFLEGKPTLPLILALNNGCNGLRLKELFVKKEKDTEEIEEVLEYLSHSDVLEEARRYARTYASNAVDSLDIIAESEYKEALIKLADKVVKRNF